MTELTEQQKTEFEAAAFRTLVAHLRNRTDVQNIDLMNLSGFCRNCLSNWYQDAAAEAGIDISKQKPAKSSTACPTTSGKQNTRRKRRKSRRQNSPPPIRITRTTV